MSSFWLILKQQWTIKISSPLFSIFCLAAMLVGSRDHRTHFWKGAIQGPFHQSLVQIGMWLQRSWLKCEKLTDGHSVVTIAHLTLWVRWAKNAFMILNYFLRRRRLQDKYKIGLSMVNIEFISHGTKLGKRLTKARLSPHFWASSNKFYIHHQ